MSRGSKAPPGACSARRAIDLPPSGRSKPAPSARNSASPNDTYAASESSRSVQIFCSRVCVCAMVPPFGTIASKRPSRAPKFFLMVVPLLRYKAILRGSPLLHSHVLGEIIVRAAIAFEAPAYTLGVITAGEDIGQEALLRGPAGFGLGLAITARHGVVEPAVRRARVEVNVVALTVGFEAVAKALHILDRDDVVGLAEGREDWTGKRCNHLVERLWLQLVHLPFALGGGAVPHNRSADRCLGSEYERMPPGLAVASDDDFAQVRGRVLPQGRKGGLDQLDGFRIGEVVSRLARIEGGLVGMAEKEIWRQHGVSVARATHRLVARVLHEAVALVHQDHGREASTASRICQERGHSVVASNVLGGDIAHGLRFGAGRAERGKSAEESKLPEEFTPWGESHCGPPRRC